MALKIAIALISVMSIMVLARDFVITHKYILVMLIGMLGFSTGALFMYPLSMTADAIDYEEYVAGTRSEGIYYGCLTFGYKVAQAAVIFIVGILLDFINFDSSLNVQSESTVITMGLIFSCGSLIAFLIAYYSYKKYTLTKTEILEIQNNKKNV